MGITREIAQFANETRFEDFDVELVKTVKSALLSGVGMTVAGADTQLGRDILNYVKEKDGPQEAGVIGASYRTSVEYAAVANGTLSHATELEDVGALGTMYSVGIFPSVLALAEKHRASGKEVIEAFVVAWDIGAKLALASSRSAMFRGAAIWCAYSTIGTAASSARLLKLDLEATTMAVSLATSHASGLFGQVGFGAHTYEAGLAGRNGIASALLAKHGVVGRPDIMEMKQGYMDSTAGVTDLDLKLGAPYAARQIEFKRYPCVNQQIQLIDSVLELIEKHRIAADDVEAVQADVPPRFAFVSRFQDPETGEDARFSLPHSFACCFLDGKPWLESYTTDKANDPQIKAFRRKVRMVVHPEWTTPETARGEVPIVIRLKNGIEYKCAPRLDAPNVMSEAEIVDKYMRCVQPAFSKDKAEQIAEAINSLDKAKDISSLMTLLTFPDGKR